jgi:dTDP-L-rhamnose 4-epimerase
MILVTGGAGFIGSHVADELLEAGHEVRVLDLLHPLAHAARPDYLAPEAEVMIGDLNDRELLDHCLEGVTAVSHQASMVGLRASAYDMTEFARHNDLGTATLLEALAARGFDGRLVLASSMVVYGEGRYRCARHGVVRPPEREATELAAGRFEPACPVCAAPLSGIPVTEDAPLEPTSVYAATKVHQEHLCMAFVRATGAPVTALRYHNVYGPRMPRDTPYAGVAAIFASALARGDAPQVLEDGRQRRDFVHVRDVARANVLALTATEPFHGALNVASGTPRTVAEMAESLADAMGPDAPRPKVTGGWRPGDVRHVFASPARARDALGFVAHEDFREGMAEFAAPGLRGAM